MINGANFIQLNLIPESLQEAYPMTSNQRLSKLFKRRQSKQPSPVRFSDYI